jgi:hypothetical protein
MPWFDILITVPSGNYGGFKGRLGSSLTAASPQTRIFPIGIIRDFSGVSESLAMSYGAAFFTTRATAGTAITPWRLAGPLAAGNRTPRFNLPDSPGRTIRTIGVTFTGATTTVNATAHPFVVNDVIGFANTGGALPAAVNNTSLYVVLTTAANSFTVGSVVGGTAITFATAGSGTHSAILRQAYWDGLNMLTESFRRGIDSSGATNLVVGSDYVL